MVQRNVSLQSSDSPYLRNAVSPEEHDNAVSEMAAFENMATSFGQEFSPFVDDDDQEEED